MEGESYVPNNKKRRRSSLFVDRRSRIFDDDDVHLTQNEPNCSAAITSGNINARDIQNYISSTKQCYKDWRLHQKEVKSKLEVARNAKPLQFDEKTLMDCLTLEDRSLLEEAKDFLDQRSQLANEISSAVSTLEALVDDYEMNKRLMDVIYDDLADLHRATIVNAIENHRRSVEGKLGGFPTATEWPTSHDAPQILHYESDPE